MFTRALFVAMTGVLALVAAVDASAARGGLRLDFEDGNYGVNGQGWETLQFADVDGTPQNLQIDLGFQVDFGSGPTSTLFINENGFVSFNQAVEFDGTALTLLGLGAPVIAPYYADLQSSTPPSGTFPFFTPLSVSYTFGVLDLAAPFDHTNDVDAIRINWDELTEGGSTVPHFQLVIYRDPDNPATQFGLEFNYEGTAGDLFPQLAGFALGTNVVNLDLNSDATLYSYTFGGGTDPNPNPVPEPGTLLLLITGLGLIGAAAIRRRLVLQPVP